MKAKTISALFIGLLVFGSKVSHAQKTIISAPSPEDLVHIKNIESNLRPVFVLQGKTDESDIPSIMKKDHVAGVSIAFVANGRIAWVKCYGYANLSDSARVTPATIFLAASLSKPITAMGALNLVEKGLLNLDEDVNNQLKSWKVPDNEYTQKQKVTLSRLIGHTSGITLKKRGFVTYYPGEFLPTTAQLLSGEKPSKDSTVYVEFEPGSRLRYSNAGYVAIQQLMEDVTGKPLAGLLQNMVLKPCGMSESSLEQPIPQRLMKKKALGYPFEGEAFKYGLYPFSAAAGMWTTPTDLGKFMIELFNDYAGKGSRLLSQKMMREVFAKNEQRLGFTKIIWGKDVMFRHSGANDGFTCFMSGMADKQQGIIIMTNSANGDNLIEHIERAVAVEYNWEYMKPEILHPVKIDPAKLHEFAGDFGWNGDKLTFEAKKDKLFIQSKKMGDAPLELIPVGDDTFLLPSVPMKFIFQRDSNNNIKKLQVVNEHADYSTSDKVN